MQVSRARLHDDCAIINYTNSQEYGKILFTETVYLKSVKKTT